MYIYIRDDLCISNTRHLAEWRSTAGWTVDNAQLLIGLQQAEKPNPSSKNEKQNKIKNKKTCATFGKTKKKKKTKIK